MWFKAWKEIKPRIGMMLVIGVILVVFQLAIPGGTWRDPTFKAEDIAGKTFLVGYAGLPPAGSPDLPAQLSWRVYLQLAAIMTPMIGIMIGGSGILSQIGPCLREATHPSMIYTLSLPVPRRHWLYVRCAMGVLLTAAATFVIVTVPQLIAPFKGMQYSWIWAVRCAPFLFLGALVFESLAVLLDTFRNENWRLGAVLVMLLCIGVQIIFGNRVNIFPFVAGLQTSLAEVLFCVTLTAGFFWSARLVLDRRDF
jgi:hypothetical protein